MSKMRKTLLLCMACITVVLVVVALVPRGVNAGDGQPAPCAHLCGTEEGCTGDAATCPHAQHTEGECASQSEPCAHVCGTEEPCTGDAATCPHAGHEANACEEQPAAILHTLRFFATLADVTAGAPIATASVADGAALPPDAFPGPAALGLPEGTKVTWRMAEGGAPLLPGTTALTYETATVVDVYAEVAPSLQAPPVKAPAIGIVVTANGTVLTPLSNGGYVLPSLAPDHNKTRIWCDAEGNYYLPECVYMFGTDTTLTAATIDNSDEARLTLSDGKSLATEKEFIVPQKSHVILPYSGVFGDELIQTWTWTDDEGEHNGTKYFTPSNKGKKVTLTAVFAQPTHTVTFKAVPAEYGTLTQGGQPSPAPPPVKVEKDQALDSVDDFVNPVAVAAAADGVYIYYFEGWYDENNTLISTDPQYDFKNSYTRTFDADATIEARFDCIAYTPLPSGTQLVYKWKDGSAVYNGALQTHKDDEGAFFLRKAGEEDEAFDPATLGLDVTHLSATASGTTVRRDSVTQEVVGYPMDWGNGSVVLYVDDDVKGYVDVTAAYGPIEYEASVFVITPAPLTLTTLGAEKLYDGAPLRAGYSVAFGSAVIGGDVVNGTDLFVDIGGQEWFKSHVLTLDITGARTNAGHSPNTCENARIMAGSDDRTANFAITYRQGTLSVARRPVTLTAHSGGPYLADTTSYTVSGFTIERQTADNPHRGLLPGHVLSGLAASAQAYRPGTYPVAFSGSPVVTSAATGGQNLADNYLFTTVEGTMVLQALGEGAPSPSAPARPAGGTAPPTAPEAAAPAGSAAQVPTAQPDAKGETITPEGTPTVQPLTAGTGGWSLVNLLVAVLCAVLAALLLTGLLAQTGAQAEEEEGERRKKRGVAWRVLAMLAGVAAPVVFLVFENLNSPMVTFNGLTPWMAAILLVQVAAVLLLKLAGYKEAEQEA